MSYVVLIILKILVLPLTFFGLSTDLCGEHPPIPLPADKIPILLVHGYLGHSTNWVYMRHRLKKANLGPAYTVNLGSPFHSIRTYANRVHWKARQIAKETGRDDLILIGHSMGGLVSAYYATHLAPENTVTDLITLGTPWYGSRIASIGFGHCAREMRYRSPFLQALGERVKESSSLRLYQMASNSDLIVRPTSSALLEHKEAKTLVFPKMGHVAFLFSIRVADSIIQHLEEFSHPFEDVIENNRL